MSIVDVEVSGGGDGRVSRRTLNRNWDELMQELRAAQTGVQILTGFLLTVPFSSRFGTLGTHHRWLYVAVLCGAVSATCLILAPVAFHRLLFRKRQRMLLVESANRLALAGLGTLVVTLSAMVFLVVDVVLGRSWAAATGGSTLVLFLALWLAVPIVLARLGRFPTNPAPDAPLACGGPSRGRAQSDAPTRTRRHP